MARIVAPYDQRSKLNSTGTTIVENTVVRIDPTDPLGVALPADAANPLYGVLQNADLPDDGTYGVIQIRGVAFCRAAGALAQTGILLMTDTAGRVVAHALADSPVGILLTTAAGIDDLVEVELIGPGNTGI